jgi:hypothetical protein
VIDEYRAAGYDFLVLTDHVEARWDWAVTDTTTARGAGFTTLLGAELNAWTSTRGDQRPALFAEPEPVADGQA